MRSCDGTTESGTEDEDFSPSSQTHVSLTLNPRARPGPEVDKLGLDYCSCCYEPPHKRPYTPAEQATVEVWGMGGRGWTEGGKGRDRGRVRNRQGVVGKKIFFLKGQRRNKEDSASHCCKPQYCLSEGNEAQTEPWEAGQRPLYPNSP